MDFEKEKLKNKFQ